MKYLKPRFLFLIIVTLILSSCTSEAKNIETVLEVTTFNLKTTANALEFNKIDAVIENNYTSKQPGFIRRQSGVNEQGKYVVLVYWKSLADAKASMNKFMSDSSVTNYASMIEGESMKMSRFTINDAFTAPTSTFTELMTFNTKEGINIKDFNKTNKKVETKFTVKQKGFLQRITGSNEKGEQVVLVYWDTKENSNAVINDFMSAPIAKEFMGMMDQSTIDMVRYESLTSLKNVTLSNKDKVVALLNSFNTGDQTPISYINPKKYIQHNLGVADGLEGFGAVMQHAPEGGFKAEVIRAFQDEDYVFTHTKYDFFGPKAGFDIFRFEDGLIVEHWDNLLEIQKPNPSGRTQFDGATTISNLDKTEVNKGIVRGFIEKVLLNGEMDKVSSFINPEKYIQHNPAVADGLSGFGEAMKYFAENGLVMEYDKLHMVLGQGNFVLTVSEGKFGKGEHTAYYDLFRIEDGLIVEHWDVIAPIPPKSEWKNENGKF
ncbi:putative SnoaL-like aldol condensation-catalyzing enzyme [Maribacter vaceletii]|uniref:Putative SnoaL-like aldol condensation-catalyzing enzyme n=1 Tax=Maribacter vaceletii TaxID=1206816 RepID=A0A495E7U3_9FLAO|nr:nuclear transport factor 2 family protein [Maribacter vaceletii]RKR13012.1 putative SnoaL-like aldol condensation-catalyzing enzyme [Maribacter vaceletii]